MALSLYSSQLNDPWTLSESEYAHVKNSVGRLNPWTYPRKYLLEYLPEIMNMNLRLNLISKFLSALCNIIISPTITTPCPTEFGEVDITIYADVPFAAVREDAHQTRCMEAFMEHLNHIIIELNYTCAINVQLQDDYSPFLEYLNEVLNGFQPCGDPIKEKDVTGRKRNSYYVYWCPAPRAGGPVPQFLDSIANVWDGYVLHNGETSLAEY
jgi:hypothetical protein